MLSIDFASLIAQHPRSAAQLRAIRAWLAERSGVNVLEPQVLARDLPSVAPAELNDALGILVRDGGMKQCYRVIHPQKKTFVAGSWNHVAEIPEQLRDQSDEPFEPGLDDVVVVLEEE